MQKGSVRKGNNMMGIGVMGGNFVQGYVGGFGDFIVDKCVDR